MDLCSDDSDAEFFDARDEVTSPRSPDRPVSDGAYLLPLQPPKDTVQNTSDEVDGMPPEIHDEVSDAVAEPVLKPSEASLRRPSAELSGQTPDLLRACVQDRPTDLPGVKPVSVAPHCPAAEKHFQASSGPVQDKDIPAIVTEEKSDNVGVHSKEDRPAPADPDRVVKKKVPPSRPAPPKRPPPPRKSTLSSKPYLSESDEGLLTPNTTIDNITREFAEALRKDEGPSKKNIGDSKLLDPKPAATTLEPAEVTIRRKSSSSSRKSTSSPASTLNKDEEILSAVIVKNLDTGESMPLSTAADHVSPCLNPLALQIISRTREFSYTSSTASVNSHEMPANPIAKLEYPDLVDSDSLSLASDDIDIGKDAGENKQRKGKTLKEKRKKLKKIVGKSVTKVKVVAGAQVEKAVHKVKHNKDDEQLNVSSDEDSMELGSSSSIKIKASSSNKGPYHFSRPKQVQDIAVHVGAVWCMKFSHCGRLLATSGQDNVIWVWVLKEFYNYFNDMRIKYDSRDEALAPQDMMPQARAYSSNDDVFSSPVRSEERIAMDDDEDTSPFRQVPFSSYVGHSADVLDLAWSKTVRLWHISRKECLCCFQHIDFVTAIAFHPRDDRYFLSGSLDSKLRLWNIPDKKVALWNEVSPEGSSASSNAGGNSGALITTVNFCENGKFAVCGTYDGRCVFFDTEVTSNDSRVRLYDLRDLSLVCKYRGHANMSSQIKASFSPDSKYIVCGSEDKCVYIWKTSLPQDIKLSSLRRDRNDAWESMKAHDAVVTCAVFAPQPSLLYKSVAAEAMDTKRKTKSASILSLKAKKPQPEEVNVIISADFNGVIKVTVCAE